MSNCSRDANRSAHVAVIGAAGHTGRLVLAELGRRRAQPVAVVRNGSAGDFPDGVDVRHASVDYPGSLRSALAGAEAVINCAGPFRDTALQVAAAATACGAHYLDVSAEQQSVLEIHSRYERRAGSVAPALIPGMGFFGGFADLLAAAAIERLGGADDIAVMIALDSWHPTGGTRRTGARNTFARVVIEDGALVPQVLPPRQTGWTFADPFGRQEMLEVPLSEIVVIARHLSCPRIHTYLNGTALRDLRDPSTPSPVAVDDRGRSAQRFAVQVAVRHAGRTQTVEGAGRDIYAFTAPLVCEAALRLCDGPPPLAGALAPAELFPPGPFLDAMAAAEPTFSWRLV